MATLSKLVVQISGNTQKLTSALSKAEGRLKRFKDRGSKALKAVSTAAKGLAIGGGIAIAGFAVAAVKNFLDVGEQLDKMSKRTGFTVESLGELKFAAEQAGSGIETIEKGVKRMASTVLDAQLGLTSATDALDALGISVESLQGLSPEEQFQTFANALSQVEDASTKAALAQDVFGRAGTELLPLFAEGEEGMDALRRQAVSLGIVMSGEAAAGAADFNDSMNELKQAALGAFTSFASKLLPKLSEFARWLVSKKPEVVAFFEELREKAKPFFESFRVGIKTVRPILEGFFRFIYKHKLLFIATMVAIGIAIFTALGPVSQAVVAIVGIVTLIGWLRDNWKSIWGKIKDIFDRVMDLILGIFNSKFAWLLPAGPLIKALLFLHKNWDTIWNKIKEIFKGVLDKIVSIYNNTIAKIPGIAKIDMEKVEGSLLAVKDTAEVTGEGFGQASTIMSDNADRMAKRIGDSSVRIVTSSSSVAVAVEGDSVKIVEAQDAAKAAVEALAEANRKAAKEFWDKSIDMRWNLSETGIAWQALGGSVESVVRAMAATTGQSELSIISSFEGMRREGETWKDLLLRLEKEGVINLDKLGGAMNALEADTRRARREAEKLNRILGATVGEIRGIAEELNKENAAIRRDQKIEELRQQVAAASDSWVNLLTQL